MKKLRFGVCFLLILCFTMPQFSCGKSELTHEKTSFSYFDTVSHIYSYRGDEEAEFEGNCREIEEIFSDYHKLFDIYNEYEGINNLCTLNKRAGGEWLEVDARLIDFLLYAKEIYEVTDGETNVMMGSVLSLWHTFRESKNENKAIPSIADLSEASLHTSIDLLEIDEKNNKIRISNENASIDVGAIAKGYAVEIAAKLLEERQAEGYVIDVGGNIRIIGKKPDGNGWVTGIKNPFGEGESELILISDVSCVTSGNYERYFEADGKRYHHIIDKDTLMPSEHFVSVTVVCRDSGLADALSTALFCMPYEEGILLVEELDGVCAMWICADGEKLMSQGFKNLLNKK